MAKAVVITGATSLFPITLQALGLLAAWLLSVSLSAQEYVLDENWPQSLPEGIEWGHKDTGPGEFDLPHTIVIDQCGRVLVGDRANQRIQIFDQQGNYISEWDQFGWPSGMFIDQNDVLYVADYQDCRGVTYGSAEDGAVMGFIGGSEPEGVVVDTLGNAYTGEVTAGEGGDGMIMKKSKNR